MPAKKKRMVQLDLALQGGGSHGAFTWGVIDRLLEEDWIEISGVSGTSAGAMNACALAGGLATGGREGAKAALERYWDAVSDAAVLSPFSRSISSKVFGDWSVEKSPMFWWASTLVKNFSPYALNPFGLDPLRRIVEQTMDFAAINSADAIHVFVAATNIRTGRVKIFRKPEINADALLVSACLPTISHAVEIDGEAYWDGGYMGNPPLFPLADETETRDVMLVQINPFEREGIPKTALEIHDRLNEITFNASLIRELKSLRMLGELIHEEKLDRAAYREGRLHMIGADDEVKKLGASSKMNGERKFLHHLRDLGRERAEAWLDAHRDDLGVQTTFKLDFVIEESLQPAHLREDTKLRPVQAELASWDCWRSCFLSGC